MRLKQPGRDIAQFGPTRVLVVEAAAFEPRVVAWRGE